MCARQDRELVELSNRVVDLYATALAALDRLLRKYGSTMPELEKLSLAVMARSCGAVMSVIDEILQRYSRKLSLEDVRELTKILIVFCGDYSTAQAPRSSESSH